MNKEYRNELINALENAEDTLRSAIVKLYNSHCGFYDKENDEVYSAWEDWLAMVEVANKTRDLRNKYLNEKFQNKKHEYEVCISGTWSRTITVKANSKEDAKEKTRELICNGTLDLDNETEMEFGDDEQIDVIGEI